MNFEFITPKMLLTIISKCVYILFYLSVNLMRGILALWINSSLKDLLSLSLN